MRVRLLLISSDPVQREAAKLEARGFSIALEAAPSPQYAEGLFAGSPHEAPQAILIDLQGIDRKASVRWARKAFPEARVVLLQPAGSSDQAASPSATWDPERWDAGGDLAVARPHGRSALRGLLKRLVEALATCGDFDVRDHGESALDGEGIDVRGLDELIGRSVRFREALEIAMRAASDARAPVLVTGEKGTGKRLFARAIHAESEGALGPYIRIDCRAMNVRELEAALLGDGRTAGRTPGATISTGPRQAGGGTLFLEEIAALDLGRQAKVLTFLHDALRVAPLRQSRKVARPRLIAATAEDLDELSRRGGFNPELLARLQTHKIDLPALRERPSDILLLAERFLSRKAYLTDSPVPKLSREVQEQLLSNPWPGNVRELFGVLEAALDAARGEAEVEPRHLPDWLLMPDPSAARGVAQEGARTPPRARAGEAGACIAGTAGGVVVELPDQGMPFEEIEKAVLRAALEMADGNVVHAARLLRLGRGSLRYRLEKYGLVEPRRRRPAKRRPGAPESRVMEAALRKAS